ncbi:PAS domain S-box protein [Marinoscillum sp.]|uniref:hybrid sensor histidine kinase/response regulator n=1 Tax=Marinoscillum sp. TaxID=2024838 RepID=UPI003BAA956A
MSFGLEQQQYQARMKKEYHILHVEDNPGDIFLIAKSLEQLDLNVHVTVQHRLSDAMSWLSDHTVDVVLLDLNLPDSDGLSALCTLMKHYPSLCTVVLTGNENWDIGEKSVQYGAQDFLVKNAINEQLLLKTITYSYERHKLSNKVRESEAHLQEIYDTVTSVIFKISVEGPNRFRYLMVNHAFCKRIGKQSEEIIGKLVEEVLPSNSIAQTFREYNKAITSKTTNSWEMKMDFDPGQTAGIVTLTPHFNDSGACEYIIGSVQDLTEVNKANEALRESEAFLKSLFENSLSAVLVADDEGNYSAVNSGAEQMFGYSRNEFMKMNLNDICVLNDYSSADEYDSFKEEGIKTGEFHFYNKQGERKCALYHATRLRRDFNVSVLIDITERMKYQQEVRKLSLIAKETINGAIMTDAQGLVTWCNRALEEQTGYKLREMLGKKPGRLLQGPDSNPETMAIMHEAVANQESFEVEILNYRKSGDPFWFRITSQPLFDSKGQLEGFFAIQTDITQQKVYEEQIRSTKERLDAAIESAVLGVLDWDMIHDRIDVNNKYYEVIGWNPENYTPTVQNFLNELIHPQDRESMKSSFRKIYEGKVQDLNHSYRILNQKGEVQWLSIRGTIRFAEDRPVRMIGIIQNITDHVNQDKMLMQATINAQEKERERISREIHDGLQQTLVTAMFNLESVKSNAALIEPYASRLERGIEYVNKGIAESRNIAHQLLPRAIKDFGYGEAVQSLLAGIQDRIAVQYYDNLKGERLCEELELNLFRITQEALSNIVKHSEATKVIVQLIAVDKNVILSIEDNGKGFDADLKNCKTNGLNSIHSRATALGGLAQIDSMPGKGSLLLINIPKKEIYDKHYAS